MSFLDGFGDGKKYRMVAKKNLTKPFFEQMLREHYKWLEDSSTGKQLDLSDCDLRGIKLYQCNLTRVNLAGANLEGVNLMKANLSYADLSNAKLKGAKLSYINAVGADFTGADLRKAELFLADLRLAKLDNSEINGAQVLKMRTSYMPKSWENASVVQDVEAAFMVKLKPWDIVAEYEEEQPKEKTKERPVKLTVEEAEILVSVLDTVVGCQYTDEVSCYEKIRSIDYDAMTEILNILKDSVKSKDSAVSMAKALLDLDSEDYSERASSTVTSVFVSSGGSSNGIIKPSELRNHVQYNNMGERAVQALITANIQALQGGSRNE